MTYEELGKKVKREHPGTYDDWDDEMLGRRYAAKRQQITDIEVKTPEVLPPERDPFSLAEEIKKKKETRNTEKFGLFAWFNEMGENARANLARAQADHANALITLETAQAAAVAAEEHTKHAASIARIEAQVRVGTAAAQVATYKNQVEVFARATQQGMTAATYEHLLTRKKELLMEMEKAEDDLRLEIQRLQVTADIEINKAKQMDHNRLEAYQREVIIDFRAALAERTIGHQVLFELEQYYQKLLVERSELENNKLLSPAMKQKALEAKDVLIAKTWTDLNEQMAKHLLKAGDGQDRGADEEADDSPAGN